MNSANSYGKRIAQYKKNKATWNAQYAAYKQANPGATEQNFSAFRHQPQYPQMVTEGNIARSTSPGLVYERVQQLSPPGSPAGSRSSSPITARRSRKASRRARKSRRANRKSRKGITRRNRK